MQSFPIATAGNANTGLQVAVESLYTKHMEQRKKWAEMLTRLDELASQHRELGFQDSELDALCNKFKRALQVQELDANSVITRKDASSCKTIPMSSEDGAEKLREQTARLWEDNEVLAKEVSELEDALRRVKEQLAGAAAAEI